MRVFTITCHDVYNYGASLQAYALQEYCRACGHEYQIIDYKPPYLSNHYKLGFIANPRFDRPIIKQLYILAKLPGRLFELKRKRRFDEFTRNHLSLTSGRFTSSDELAENCPDGDLFIAGSDQIWNTLFKNGRDKAFYLDFVGEKGRKISYAASFSTDGIPDEYREFVREKLSNFNAISVRESSARNILSDLGFNECTLVCDPVFLIDEKRWRNLAGNVNAPKRKYIFLYDCERSRELRLIAEKLHHRLKLPIYSVSPISCNYAQKDFMQSGPLEFLNLIANADFVIANSFHALAFSLIFKKNFFIVKRTESINTRMRDFLAYLGLNNRLIDASDEVGLENIDYKGVDAKLATLISQSKDYLDKQF